MTREEEEMRSERIMRLLERMPRGVTRCGMAIMVILYLMVILTLVFMPYPYSAGETILQHILQSI